MIHQLTTCERCPLHKCRTQVVKGIGSVASPFWIFGQNPGVEEDGAGEPFVGSCGELLNEVIESIGLKRSEVRIDNAVRCKSPNNRAPKSNEIEKCYAWTQKSLKCGSPKFILTLGNAALEQFTAFKGITKWRGHLFYYTHHDFYLLPTYHPSAILREGQKGERTAEWNMDWLAVKVLSKQGWGLFNRKNNPVEEIGIKLYG